MEYTIYHKVISKVTEEVKYYTLFRSSDICEVVKRLEQELSIHRTWNEKLEMTDGCSFIAENDGYCNIYHIYAESERKIERW